MIEVNTDMYNRFMATVIPGFEDILEAELVEELKTCIIQNKERGKVLFTLRSDRTGMEKISCADNFYCIIDEFPVGYHREDLPAFSERLKKIKWRGVFTQFANKNDPAVIFSASKKGKHTFSRFDVENIIKGIALAGATGCEGSNKEHDLAVRADVSEGLCRISIQLTPADFKYRGDRYSFSRGSIRPTVAAALVRISNPRNTDVFYDPFCGSGTIAMERSRYPARRILASDIDDKVVEAARNNIDNIAILYCCDATVTPVKNESISIIVSNPPWGKQIEVSDLQKLYIDFLIECNRILKKDGEIILLTDRKDELLIAAKMGGFHIEIINSISLHGLRPDVFYLKRLYT